VRTSFCGKDDDTMPGSRYDASTKAKAVRLVREHAGDEPGENGRRPPESLYGTVKMWAHLNRQGIPVAKCTIERLKRAHGWRGVTQGRKVRTTVADPAAARAPNLVRRQFKASPPGQLHVADFTYVPLVTGRFAYTAFVIDAFAGLIPGWECSVSKETAFVESEIRQATAYRTRQGHPITGDAIHHSDAGSQDGFNRSSQHLDLEVWVWDSQRGWAAAATGRPPMQSPGRPPVARRGERQRFWAAMARGLSSEDAAVKAGVSPVVGTRWFREAVGMPPITQKPLSGRYLSFAEREEIAILRARGCGVREIAWRTDRPASTVSRELRRNAATCAWPNR
jgi:transposase InsO family protein